MIKKYAIAVSAAVLVFSGAVLAGLPSFAAGKAAPKATGGVGYTAYGVQRSAEFSAIESTTNCSSSWDVTGTYVLDFKLNGDPTIYSHDAFLTQTGTSVSGNGGYPVGGPYAYSWHITSGSVTGNTVSLSILYDTGATGTVMTMAGSIASNGTMSGTWQDNFGGTRNGTWATNSGNATKVAEGCTGKGTFNYSDVNGNFYTVDVQYVNVSGNETWFAGPVVSGNVGAGNWLFAKVKDVGTPGSSGDQIWGSFATQAQAINGVATMSIPADGPFNITSGNLVVH